MANKPFDREVINVRERPLSTDLNTSASYGDQALRYMVRQQALRRSSASDSSPINNSGWVGNGFKVRANNPANMTVTVNAGVGFQDIAFNPLTDLNIGSALVPGVSGLDDLSSFRPIVLDSPHTFTVPAADPVNPRIDIVEVKVDRRLTDTALRAVLDPGTGVFNPTNVPKTMTYAVDGNTEVNTTGGNSTAGLAYKTGVPAGAPVAPATSVGYVKIAEVRVNALAASVPFGAINDYRKLLAPQGAQPFSIVATFLAGALTAADYVLPPGVEAHISVAGVNAGSIYLLVYDNTQVKILDPKFSISANSVTVLPATSVFSARANMFSGSVSGGQSAAWAASAVPTFTGQGQDYLEIGYDVLEVDGGAVPPTVGPATNLPVGAGNTFYLNVSGYLYFA